VDDEFQAITDEMNNTAMDDPKMKDLFRKGMEIWYENLPDAPITQWYHRIPVNYHVLGQLADPGEPVRELRPLGLHHVPGSDQPESQAVSSPPSDSPRVSVF
jgi:hypothetical protein